MKRKYSTFDYPLILSRKNRYLVVGSSDFGYQVGSVRLDLGQVSAESIGRAVISLWNRICQNLHELEREGKAGPKPKNLSLLTRELLTTREAARLLGVSPSSLRRLVRAGKIPCERTPSGRLRFLLDELAQWISKSPFPQPQPLHQEAV